MSMQQSPESPSGSYGRLRRTAPVLIVSTVMLTFISYWKTAAVVLCDLASTAYYIGGIVESIIGPAAPFFILAVMLFSYAVRSVYIESCSLFVRGGVYRVVKEALGGFLAKLSVSALMFDYILTGPTSGVSAGQYIMGLIFQILRLTSPTLFANFGLNDEETRKTIGRWGAVALASLVTLYFFRQNLLGIHESSDKAVKIMIATTIMAVIMITWCLVTLAIKGPANELTWKPQLDPKTKTVVETDPITGKEFEKEVPRGSEALEKVGIHVQDDPLGLLGRGVVSPETAQKIRHPPSWLSIFGIIGLFIAFGHSVLAMSGEETLAQVYREVESPKMLNFKKAAFIVFVYSVVLTAGISFLAVLIIPDKTRMSEHSDNLIGGLARYMVGDPRVLLFLEAFVVIVGFLILSGAVNTAIIGSNGVLNRVAEDGVLPDWFLKPHPRYGTTYRVLWLITGLQLGTIIFSGGDMVILGEAYAFGVVWSFVFKALAMVVLRFKDKTPREYKVPGNIRVGRIEIPLGLIGIFVVLLFAAAANFFTKEVATVGGIGFTVIFLVIFVSTEHYHERKRKGAHHKHLEQFNQQTAGEVTPESLGLTKPYRKLVSIRSTQNLYMLEKALAEADPETTAVVVMTAKMVPIGASTTDEANLDSYDQTLMTAVVERAEKAGKQAKPLIVPTNNPLHAILNAARELQAHELIIGASNKYTADEQLEQVAFYWIDLCGGTPAPLTVRILSRDRDMTLDLGGGNRIPKISERKARNVAELRAAGVGVDRVLLVHEGTPEHSDLFQAVLTALDPEVALAVAPMVPADKRPLNGPSVIQQDEDRARNVGRALTVLQLKEDSGAELVRQAQEGQYDLIILPLPSEIQTNSAADFDARTRHVLGHAHCRVFLAAAPVIPTEVVDTTQK
jgi:amino acid transporter